MCKLSNNPCQASLVFQATARWQIDEGLGTGRAVTVVFSLSLPSAECYQMQSEILTSACSAVWLCFISILRMILDSVADSVSSSMSTAADLLVQCG